MTVMNVDDRWFEAQLACILASIIDSTLLKYLLFLPCYVRSGMVTMRLQIRTAIN